MAKKQANSNNAENSKKNEVSKKGSKNDRSGEILNLSMSDD